MADNRGEGWGKRIQQRAIAFVVAEIGDDVFSPKRIRTNRHQAIMRFISRNPDVGIKARTIHRWIKHYGKFGEAPEVTRRRREVFCKKYGIRPGPNMFEKTWDQDVTIALKCIVDQNPSNYLDEFQALLYLKTGKLFSYKTISAKIKAELKYSLKQISEKALQQSYVERENYLRGRRFAVGDRPEMCVFIDETHKSSNASRRRKCWGPKGNVSVAFTPFGPIVDRRFTLLAACDVNGFIVEACELVERERNRHDDDPFRGTIDTERFEHWVEHKLCPSLGRYAFQEPRSIVFLDNATIHYGERVVDLIRSTGAIIMYTSPYSPDLNTIELMFASYKHYLKRHSKNEGGEMRNHLFSLMDSVSPLQARNFFRKALVPGCEEEKDTSVEEIAVTLAMITTSSS